MSNKKKLKRLTKILAYQVRYSIEDMHSNGFIPQDKMKEFNSNVRNSIYTMLLTYEKASIGDSSSLQLIHFLEQNIPPYWEEPKEIKSYNYKQKDNA